MKTLFTILLGIVVPLAIVSCGGDDEPKKEQLKVQFKSQEKIIPLSDAKIYLHGERNYENSSSTWKLRDYLITDGTFKVETEGDGWSIDDYNNATFLIAIEIGTPGDSGFPAVEYPNYSHFYDVTEGNLGYMFVRGTNDRDGTFESSEIAEITPIQFKGGLEHGETLSIQFKGILTKVIFNTETETYDASESPSSLYYTGSVIDTKTLTP